MWAAAGWGCRHASKMTALQGRIAVLMTTLRLCCMCSKPDRAMVDSSRCACMQATLDSAHSMKRTGSVPRTSSAKTLNSVEQPVPHHTHGVGPQAPSQQVGGADLTAAGQHRTSQPHRPDQAAGPEGSVQQPLLSRQGSKGLSAAGGVRSNGHAR